MKLRSILPIGLLAVMALAACAPAATPIPAEPGVSVPTVPRETEPPVSPTSAPTESQPELPPAEAPPTEVVEAPQAVATSRGPDLEATDPATVSLASGELQLVEFFRFT